jgi:hypothetical protein
MPWDGEEMVQEEARYFKAGHRNLPAQVFMSVGGSEQFKMQPLMRQLAATIPSRQYKGLQLTDKVLENETHTSVVPTALNKGLRAVRKEHQERLARIYCISAEVGR